MPDTRQHRGPHPDDRELFAANAVPALRDAAAHLSWLQSRGYAWASALKLVGDRFQLTERQRTAVLRSSCSDGSLARRRQSSVPAAEVRGRELHVDGFNLLTTVEAALSGGVVLRARDGCDRDMASMHGSYRRIAETRPALVHIGEVLAELGAGPCRWLLDSPVSNSGRLGTIIREIAAERGWSWETELVANPDPLLIASPEVVASADSVILDGCGRWLNLAREVVTRRVRRAWVISFEDEPDISS